MQWKNTLIVSYAQIESIDTVTAQEKNALYVCVCTHVKSILLRITMKKILIAHNLI